METRFRKPVGGSIAFLIAAGIAGAYLISKMRCNMPPNRRLKMTIIVAVPHDATDRN